MNKGLVSAVVALLGGIATLISACKFSNETDDNIDFENEEPAKQENMPDDLYKKIRAKQGKYYADRAKSLVESGDWSIEWLERSMRRPSISPENWRDYEDGWRPNGW